MTKKTETPDTDPQLPAVKVAEQPATFASRIEDLMNYAYQQSQVEGKHQQRYADWCNALGDLWREVKSHD